MTCKGLRSQEPGISQVTQSVTAKTEKESGMSQITKGKKAWEVPGHKEKDVFRWWWVLCSWLVLLCVGFPIAVASQTCPSHSLSPSLNGSQNLTVDSTVAIVLRAAALRGCMPLVPTRANEAEESFDEPWHSCFVWAQWCAVCLHPGKPWWLCLLLLASLVTWLVGGSPPKKPRRKSFRLARARRVSFHLDRTGQRRWLPCIEGWQVDVLDQLGSDVGTWLTKKAIQMLCGSKAQGLKTPVETAAVKPEPLGWSRFSSSYLSSITSALFTGGGSNLWKKLSRRKKTNTAQQTADVTRHLIGMLKPCLNHGTSMT